MIKNVIVVNDYDYVQGGASLVAIEQANLLFARGYNVIFFCGVSNKDKSILNSNIKTIVTNKYDSLNNPNKIKGILQGANNKIAYLKMKNLLSNFKSEETVVSIHGYTKALSTSFIKACKYANVKTLLTAHDYFSICPNGGLFNYKKNRICNKQGTIGCKICNCDSRNYLFKLYRNYRFNKQNRKFKFRDNIDYLITISKTNEDLLKNSFHKSKIIRIYNPTSIDIKDSRVQCEKNDFFIYVGRIDKGKGIDLLCESFKIAKLKLLLIGSGTELKKMKNQYESEFINFIGWLKHDQVIKYMKKAKCLVLPCLLYEGAPLIIFEAQSQGIPCIVSKYSNASEFVNEKNGWIYDPYDDSLAKLLKNIGQNDTFLKSNASYNLYYKNPYTKEKYIENLVNLLENMD